MLWRDLDVIYVEYLVHMRYLINAVIVTMLVGILKYGSLASSLVIDAILSESWRLGWYELQ